MSRISDGTTICCDGVSRSCDGCNGCNMSNSMTNIIKKKTNYGSLGPGDGMILKMHYKYTFYMMVIGFFVFLYQWLDNGSISCVSKFNAEVPVGKEILNICATYPYLLLDNSYYGRSNDYNSRRYITFYRWIHWSFLLLAVLYYIPKCVAKKWENARVKKLLEDLIPHGQDYKIIDREIMQQTVRYIARNMKSHDGVYIKHFITICIALLVDLVTVFYLNVLFQGRFVRYGISALVSPKNYEYFGDLSSQMFPPFVDCKLTEGTKMVGSRNEEFGCHLSMMELYEKVFLVLWLWLIILIISTICYLVFLLLFLIPSIRIALLRPSKSTLSLAGVTRATNLVCSISGVGDLYLLYRLKQQLGGEIFYELILKLSDPNIRPKKLNILSISKQLINKDFIVPVQQEQEQQEQQHLQQQEEQKQQHFLQQQQEHQQQQHLQQQEQQQQHLQQYLENTKPNHDTYVNLDCTELLNNNVTTNYIPPIHHYEEQSKITKAGNALKVLAGNIQESIKNTNKKIYPSKELDIICTSDNELK